MKRTWLWVVMVVLAQAGLARAGLVVRTGVGANAAELAPVMGQFRADLGGANNGVSTNGGPAFLTGRREINWDAGALPGNMPADFFNNNSKRGAVFSTPGTGFLVSSNSATSAERLFGDINSNYLMQFTTNSPNRLFAAAGSTVVEVRFFVPSQPTEPATVSGFGAVFTDVDQYYTTRIECFDVGGSFLGSVDAPPTGGGQPAFGAVTPQNGLSGLSFAGISFDAGERVAMVRITSGTLPLGPTANDSLYDDVVAMDDFLYGEPQPAPIVRQATGLTAADIAGAIAAFRADIGGANNGVSTNGGAVLPTGRREINWDAAALPGNMPPDFFNSTSLRGAVFTALEGTGFLVSSNSATAPERLFGDLNPDYVTQFTTNSPNRLFTVEGGTLGALDFFVPANPALPATVHAFGAVFTDVEYDSSSLELFDMNDVRLASLPVPVSTNKGLSFIGITFRGGERVARVTFRAGNMPLGPQSSDFDYGFGEFNEVAAMDDFIYSEPQVQPLVVTGSGADGGELLSVLDAFRNAVGGLNNGVSTNGGPVLPGGRREINWDAAALPGNMPGDFFNNNSKRGAVFGTPGTGLLVSSNSSTSPERLFGDFSPDYLLQFTTNSPNRLFTALGSTAVDASFFVPSAPSKPATIGAFGAVFTDVESHGATRLEFFDVDGKPVGMLMVPPTRSQRLTFAGLVFRNGERAARVRITSGNVDIATGGGDSEGPDVVVMDDFLYGEPQEITTTSTTSTTSTSTTSSTTTSSTTSSSTTTTTTSSTTTSSTTSSSTTTSTTTSSTTTSSTTTSSTTTSTTSSTTSSSTTSTSSTSTTTSPTREELVGEAVDRPDLTWMLGEVGLWSAQTEVTHDSVDAAQSGGIEGGQESLVETTVEGPGLMEFWWKVSSATNVGVLKLFVDDVPVLQPLSGERDWRAEAYAVGPGSHVFTWIYAKSGNDVAGADAGYLDQVNWVEADGYRSEAVWDQGAVYWTNGWHHLNWFGGYSDLETGTGGWIWQAAHDSMYVDPSSTPGNIWMWALPAEWFWTSSTTYPYFYVLKFDTWFWYEPGTDNPRLFYNSRTGRWTLL